MKRIDAELGNDHAIGQSDRAAGRDAGKDAHGHTELHDHHGGNAAGESNGRTDRKIEAAADDHERHADRDDGHDRGLYKNIGEVERR